MTASQYNPSYKFKLKRCFITAEVAACNTMQCKVMQCNAMQCKPRWVNAMQHNVRQERERRRALSVVATFPHWHCALSVWTRVLPLSLCQVPRTDTHALTLLSVGVEALSDLCLAPFCSSERVEQLDCVISSWHLLSSLCQAHCRDKCSVNSVNQVCAMARDRDEGYSLFWHTSLFLSSCHIFPCFWGFY